MIALPLNQLARRPTGTSPLKIYFVSWLVGRVSGFGAPLGFLEDNFFEEDGLRSL